MQHYHNKGNNQIRKSHYRHKHRAYNRTRFRGSKVESSHQDRHDNADKNLQRTLVESLTAYINLKRTCERERLQTIKTISKTGNKRNGKNNTKNP